MKINHTVEITTDVREANSLGRAAQALTHIKELMGNKPYDLISTLTGEVISSMDIANAWNVLDVLHDHIMNEAKFELEYTEE